MKKLILLIAGVLLAFIGVQAQNANRTGIFIELQGGRAFGEVIHGEDYYYHSEFTYLKGGVVGGLGVGYRYATSNSFAIEGKVNLWADFLDIGDTFNLDIMPGIRWTSKDFSSNKSLYLSLNAGFGLNPTDAYSMFVPIEISVGFNLTNNLYLGVFLTEKMCVGGGTGSVHYYAGQSSHSVYLDSRSYTSAGIKLGYRF